MHSSISIHKQTHILENMDIGMERNEGGATIGTLFQHIVNDMKNSSPLWEDFIAKATKLHACLRAAIQALAVYLEAFQKIADAATNSKGATKEIGTALTRVCLRHKAVETRMKTFTAAIMDCLIVPLQEKLEDWKKQVAIIDKDHAKEYKRCRAELKKRSSDTLRLQKKAKKGQTDNLHILVESSMQDVTLRRSELEEVERKSLRSIMVEERSRYCTFVNMLQPVVHEECEVMSELSHLQEAMQIIAVVTKDPTVLPQASEELILESKTNMNLYPDSPGGSNSQGACSNSLGSRKSSVCSISSINSSSSGSPGHQFQRSLSQYSPAIRLKPGESSDSGFCSSPALTSQASTLASQSHAVSTWPPHTQDGSSSADRPHTISSAYEKGHQRPALTVYTFQNPEAISENQKSPANIACRPPLPVRCSSLERPLSTASIKNSNANAPRQCPSPIPAHITKEHPQLQPTYVNMTELASMAASRNTNNNNQTATNQPQSSTAQTPVQPPQQMGYQQLQQPNSPVLSSASSLISPDSSATNAISSPDVSACSTQTPQNTPQTGSPLTPIYSSSSVIVPLLSAHNNSFEEIGGGMTTANGDGGGPLLVAVDGIANPKGVAASGNESNNDSNKTPSSSTTTSDLDNNPTSQSNTNHQSQSTADKDILKCTGSVLEKTSMFEQQINNNQSAPSRSEPIYGRKVEDIYKTTGLLSDRDADRIDKETIEELNNLIGELDLFQKEHELRLGESTPPISHTRENGLIYSNHNSNGNLSSNNSDSAGSDRNDKISISSSMNIEGINMSFNSTSLGSEIPFDQSDSDTSKLNSEQPGCDSVDYSNTGFENPSFMHLNETEIVVMRQNNFGRIDPENYYSQNMSEVVVLRCKDVVKPDANRIEDTISVDCQQRLSSFKLNSRSASPALSSFAVSRSPTPSMSLPQSNATTPTMASPQHNIAISIYNNNNHNSNHVINLHQQKHQQQHLTNGNEKCSLISMPSDERINKIKPAITPRPASLSGPNRVARRSSVNTVKPPPPVRRSSSVTPSPNIGIAPNLAQQSVTYTSSDSLPPPPAYLLDSTTGNSLIPGNVAGTVKALNEIRHKPASPGVLRRAQQNVPNQQIPTSPCANAYISTPKHDLSSTTSMPYTTQSPPNYFPPMSDNPNTSTSRSTKSSAHQQGIYAQPKQITSMSSFRTASPGPQKQSTGFLAQLNARIAPNKPQPPASPQHHQQQQSFAYTTAPSNESAYHRSSPADQRSTYSTTGHQQQQQQHQHQSSHGNYSSAAQQASAHQQQQSHYHQHQQSSHAPTISQRDDRSNTASNANSNNVLAKTSAGFLENLNARLAEQRLSGKAFAVRNLINSKALPDPRLCHESLMDQIKRGATLKRNRTINDRSAPKIH